MSYRNDPVLVFTTRVILTVMPDFGGAYLWQNRDGDLSYGVGGCCGSRVLGNWASHEISESLCRDFEDWQSSFESADWSDFKDFDWAAFHREGMELASCLKKEVGEGVLVIYEKPYEDPNERISQRREVLQNGQFRVMPTRRKIEKLYKNRADIRTVSERF